MNEIIKILLLLQSLELSGPAAANHKKQITGLRAKIPAPVLGHYDRLVARGQKGVAIIRNQSCSACHINVPRGVVLTLMHNADVQLCENCGRYLYLPEPAETPEPPAAKTKSKPLGKRKKTLSLA